MAVEIREIRSDDSFEELTHVLHRAYAALAAGGLRYLASHQSTEITRRRAAKGTCLVAEVSGQLVGTITVCPGSVDFSNPCYQRQGVFVFQQWGVDPAFQRQGIGRLLYGRAETLARHASAEELMCDTSEQATQLIALYGRLGFVEVARHDYDVTNYASLVFSKRL